MRMRNGAIFVMLVVLTSLLGGCAVQKDGYFETLGETVNAGVEAQQAATRELVEAIKQSNLVDSEKMAEIESHLVKFDAYVDTAQAVATEAAAAYEAKQAESKTLAIIAAARAANAASSPVNPYSGAIEGVLGLVAVLAGGFAIKRNGDANTATKKYTAHKRVLASEMAGIDPVQARHLYDAVGAERKALGI